MSIDRKLTLITMGQGNVKALKKTLDSFKGIADEVVYGDMLIFEEDRNTLYDYEYEMDYNLRSFKLPFNYIFQMGFASCLNYLIANAKNNLCLYVNTSETIDEDYGINKIVSDNPDCNAFYFSHRVEIHRWHRCFDRRSVCWSGVIHEEAVPTIGELQPYHKPIFMMKDEEKDMDNPFKAAVFNCAKELAYFNNYRKLIDAPKIVGATNEGWKHFAQEQYESMKERMDKRGLILTAFQTGDFDLLLSQLETNSEFENERFVSSHGMNFQGARKDIL
jgi:hypothetical protein